MALSDDCIFEGIPERPVGSRWGPFFKLCTLRSSGQQMVSLLQVARTDDGRILL